MKLAFLEKDICFLVHLQLRPETINTRESDSAHKFCNECSRFGKRHPIIHRALPVSKHMKTQWHYASVWLLLLKKQSQQLNIYNTWPMSNANSSYAYKSWLKHLAKTEKRKPLTSMAWKYYNELQWNEQNKARIKATTTQINFLNLHDTLNDCLPFETQRNDVTPK